MVNAGSHARAALTSLLRSYRFCRRWLSQVVRELLEAGANAGLKDRWGSTAYDDAVRKGNRAIVEMLEEQVRRRRESSGGVARVRAEVSMR